MAKEVIVTADKVRNRKRTFKIVRRALFILLIFLIVLYVILDVIYDSLNNSQGKRKLEATPIKFMDNISYKWIPQNVDTEADGSHNGQNYIAYSFYVENQGNRVINYHYEMIIDDVIKNVDEAIRIRIYRNGEDITYAKKDALERQPEANTVPFKDIKDAEDPDCTDALLGGELKMHMVITEEHVDQG